MTGHTTPPSDTLTLGVIGLGHVGLPTALGFAEMGWHVVGTDEDAPKSDRIARGEAPFYEPGLQLLLERHIDSGLFRVAQNMASAVAQSQVLFICVGTPTDDDGQVDLSQLDAVAPAIAESLNGYKVIVEKSTSPVLTARRILESVALHTQGPHHFDMAVNPEFLREGSAVADVLAPDRLVLGVEAERARDLLLRVYQPLLDGTRPGTPPDLLITDLNTAEIIKHASNSFLAAKISFINMIADLCEATGADVTEVARGMGMDPRIAPHFLQAGAGYGGSCFPKDLRAFIQIGQGHGVDMSLLTEVERINDRRIELIVRKVEQGADGLRGKTVAILGLAFKPGTDDIRDAPSLRIIPRLLEAGAFLRLHDPQAADSVRQAFPEGDREVMYCATPAETARSADALLLLTEWDEYRTMDLLAIGKAMTARTLIDARNLYDPATVRALGFRYISVGRS